jgi:hypothetical protein
MKAKLDNIAKNFKNSKQHQELCKRVEQMQSELNQAAQRLAEQYGRGG